MSILTFLLLGLIAGAIARAVLSGDDPGVNIAMMVAGAVGALLGGLLGEVLFGVDRSQWLFSLSTWLTAIAGSVLLLLQYHLVGRSGRFGPRRPPGHRAGLRE